MIFLRCTLLLKPGWNKECKYEHIFRTKRSLLFAFIGVLYFCSTDTKQLQSNHAKDFTFHELRNYVNRISITVAHNA